MGEKQGKSDDVEKKAEQGGGEKKVEKKEEGGGAIAVVLKVDMHCEGCAKKVKRSVKGFEGVETVTTDSGNNKLMVVGKVDPWKLRERVEIKTHKLVTLVSPTDYPKKKEEPKKEEEKKEKKVEAPKPKPASVVLKIKLHCDGCIQRIKRTIRKVKGVEEVSVDTQKELITVKGTMDVKTMVPRLQDKFKRSVEIAPAAAKKDDGGEKAVKKDDGGGDKKDKEKSIAISGDKGVSGGGEKKKDGGGDGEKKKDGGGDGEKKKDGGGEKEKDGGKKKEEVVGTTKVETSKMEYYSGGYVCLMSSITCSILKPNSTSNTTSTSTNHTNNNKCKCQCQCQWSIKCLKCPLRNIQCSVMRTPMVAPSCEREVLKLMMYRSSLLV